VTSASLSREAFPCARSAPSCPRRIGPNCTVMVHMRCSALAVIMRSMLPVAEPASLWW